MEDGEEDLTVLMLRNRTAFEKLAGHSPNDEKPSGAKFGFKQSELHATLLLQRRMALTLLTPLRPRVNAAISRAACLRHGPVLVGGSPTRRKHSRGGGGVVDEIQGKRPRVQDSKEDSTST